MPVLVGRRAVTVNNGLVRRITRHTSHSEEAFIRSGSFYLFRSLCACLEPPIRDLSASSTGEFFHFYQKTAQKKALRIGRRGTPWDAVGCGGTGGMRRDAVQRVGCYVTVMQR